MTRAPNEGRPSLTNDENPTYAYLLHKIRETFRTSGIPDWRASAEWLIQDALGCSRAALLSEGREVATPQQVSVLASWVQRRLSREPVQYILGYAEFYGLRFAVDPRVLIPRPETELMVERIVETASGLEGPIRILDVATGSGCIALALAHTIPDAEVVASDFSDEALAVARGNARALRLRASFVKWNVLTEPPPLDGTFSIVVSNPPYIPRSESSGIMPEVVDYEPHAALFVDADPLLFYKAILTSVTGIHLDTGFVFFEVNPDYAHEIVELMTKVFDYQMAEIETDLAGLPRIVWGKRDG